MLSAASRRGSTSTRSKITRSKDPVASHPHFFGYLLGPEIGTYLVNVGDWLLCWVEFPNIAEKKLNLLCVRSKETEIAYVKVSRRSNGHFLGVVMPAEDGKLPPSSESSEDELAKVAKEEKRSHTLKQLIAEFETKGLPNGVMLKKAVDRPAWLLAYGTVLHNFRAVIGTGHFGRVVRGMLVRPRRSPTLVAIKITTEGKEINERVEARKKIIREAVIHSAFHHDHVVKCYGVCGDHRRLSLVMDLCCGGGLDEHIQKNCENVSPNEFRYYLTDIVKGLAYVHSLQILHRDVALRNCLIAEHGQIVVSDFGLACSLTELQSNEKDSIIHNVPIRWMAPETLQRTPVFSFATDVWAFGMLIFEVYNRGQAPWLMATTKQIRHFICDGPMPTLPTSMSDDVKRIVFRCWEKDPVRRPSMEELQSEFRRFKDDPAHPPVGANELSVFKLEGVRGHNKPAEVLRSRVKSIMTPSTT